jgi:S1 RNA binding domain protein
LANEIEVGAILEGKVTGITKFGAFVSLPGGKSGLVHISEIAYSYVNDVSDHLSEGQDVKVKVISIDENNRINLSIKRALPAPPRPAAPGRGPRPQGDRGYRPQGDRGPRPQGDRGPRPQGDRGPRSQGGNFQGDRPAQRSAPRTAASKEPKTFDDMLKQFMSDSDSKLSGRYSDKAPRRRNNNNNGRRG